MNTTGFPLLFGHRLPPLPSSTETCSKTSNTSSLTSKSDFEEEHSPFRPHSGYNGPHPSEKTTVFHFFCMQNDREGIITALKKKAHPHLPDSEGKYPIHILAKRGDFRTIQIVLNIIKGRAKLEKTPEGKTAYDIAVESDREESIQDLLRP